jgi:hypothetical protein
MTHEQIKRAAALLESLSKFDRDYDALKRATKIAAFAMDTGSNYLARFERSRSDKLSFDEDAVALHSFLLKRHRLSREKVARELRQLGVAAPELSL